MVATSALAPAATQGQIGDTFLLELSNVISTFIITIGYCAAEEAPCRVQ